MGWVLAILAATIFVAYANGANDNFKGVATLFGSGTTDYRKALAWATVTTLLGSVCAFFWARELVKTFSGKGLVPESLTANPAFMVSVIFGAALTVFIAAKTGIPISTTHSLTGALAGSGFAALGTQLGVSALGKNFFIPLLVSPFMALGLTLALYPIFRWTRRKAGIRKDSCLCVGGKLVEAGSAVAGAGLAVSTIAIPTVDVFVGNKAGCGIEAVEVYSGRMLGVSAQKILDTLHFVSAGAVSFARGLNDTPKIVALAITFGVLGLGWNIGLVAGAMALGGILSAKKVAQTMSQKITKINHGQGFAANLITAFLVIFASRMGVPVSTTHVSCGSLFGIGLANGQARWKVIGGIVGAWVLTLPAAAVTSGAIYWIIR
jgi:inorganic phosphate transporter, PiT family